ncbi:MAG: T9SS type A sorting domain-containing protein [Flavobacterium sp.]
MKIILLFTLITISFGGFAQCPPPSNLTYLNINPEDVLLQWTETGSVMSYEVAVLHNYIVGDPMPNNGSHSSPSNTFLCVAIPPGCNVFLVRSVCSATEVSPWVAVATSGCSSEIGDYLESLSTESFSENSAFTIFPNPANNLVYIKSDSEIEQVRIIDSLGKVTLAQNNTEINVEQLAKGIYTLEISTGNGRVFRKFIKE